ncbi:MAG: hypothetical protein RLZZ210_1238 [Pseudomonadota bacterium]|jgi:hypothetical protein
MNKLKFSLGQCVLTKNAQDFLQTNNKLAIDYVFRHVKGDRGDLDEEDKQANENALITNNRLLSAYLLAGQKIYVITEYDRSKTTVMLASDY